MESAVNNSLSFGYGAMFDSVPVSTATHTRIIRFEKDSDFYLSKISGSFFDVAGVSTFLSGYPLLEVMLTDCQSGNQLMDQYMLWPLLFNGVFFPIVFNSPQRLKHQVIFEAGSALQIDMRNIGTQAYTKVTVDLFGTKVYI